MKDAQIQYYMRAIEELQLQTITTRSTGTVPERLQALKTQLEDYQNTLGVEANRTGLFNSIQACIDLVNLCTANYNSVVTKAADARKAIADARAYVNNQINGFPNNGNLTLANVYAEAVKYYEYEIGGPIL